MKLSENRNSNYHLNNFSKALLGFWALKPTPLSKSPEHPDGNYQHERYGGKETPGLVKEVYIFIKIHPENSTDYCGRRQQAGYNSHHFHYFIHPEIYIINIEILHTHHNITIVFAELIGLDNVIVHIIKIFCSTIVKQVTFTA